jgi:hypothetical protein
MSFGPRTITSSQTEDARQTYTTGWDPVLQDRQSQVWNAANELAARPYQPYTGQRFEGFSPDQLAAFDMARQAAGAGLGLLRQAAGTTQGLLGFENPYRDFQAALGPAAQQIQSQAFDLGKYLQMAGVSGPVIPQQVGAATVQAERGPGGYQAYMDPYLKDVVDTSLGDIERARQEAANATRAQAAAAGAFGGSRSGVAEALTNRDFANRAASTAAQLRSAGFSQALGFNQADQNRALQAGLANQDAALRAALANQSAGLQAAGMGHNLALGLGQLGLGARGQDYDIARANQSAALQAGQFNAAQQQEANRLNAQLGAQYGLGAAQFRLGAANQLAGLGAQEQQMGAFGSELLNRIGSQQQQLGQAQRDFDYQQWLEAQQRPYQNVALLNEILNQQRYGQTGSVRTTTETRRVTPNTQRGSWGGILGGLLGSALGPMGSALGSQLGGWLFGQGRNRNQEP